MWHPSEFPEYPDGSSSQGEKDPLYLGYPLCTGGNPGINCSEPPPPDLFGPGNSGFDFKNGSLPVIDILSISKKSPLLDYKFCNNTDNFFLTITVMDMNFTDAKSLYLDTLTAV